MRPYDLLLDVGSGATSEHYALRVDRRAFTGLELMAMRWDARGLWYLFPAGLMVWSFFTDQPLQAALRVIAFIAILGITVLLRRRDPGWGRSRSAAPNRSASPDD